MGTGISERQAVLFLAQIYKDELTRREQNKTPKQESPIMAEQTTELTPVFVLLKGFLVLTR
jgi:hypothetical protein